jgi:hypothetical protein
MVGPFFLLAAALPQSIATLPSSKPSEFRAMATISAHATARIMVIAGVKFGPDHNIVPPSAQRRSAHLIDYDGQVRSAELLEFQ